MFRSVWHDKIDVTQGGLFAEGYGVIEITNLDHAAGVEGAIMAEVGSICVDVSYVRRGAEACGQGDQHALIDSVRRALVYLNEHCYDLDRLEQNIGGRAVEHALTGIRWINAYAHFDVFQRHIFVPSNGEYGRTDEQARQIALDWHGELHHVADVYSAVVDWLQNHDVDLS